MKRHLLFVGAVLASFFGALPAAQAQSACPYIAYGAVLTAAQLAG